MKVVIPGGGGQVGTILARWLHARGDEVVVLSRRASTGDAAAGWRTVAWDGRSVGGWAGEADGADVVINLAGRSVNCRYTAENMRQIMDSRVASTRAVGQAIAAANRPPRLWLQASTATIYAHRFDAANDEMTGQIGGGEPGAPGYWKFSIDVAQAWEREQEVAATPHTRKVALRSVLTLSPDRGGIFDVLLRLVRFGLGGRSGDGRQWVSWVHEHDFTAALDFLMRRGDLAGPVNIAAPHPLPNASFMAELRRAWGAKLGLPAARWVLEAGAVLMRTDTELVLKSRRVVPGRLLEAGFEFAYPTWPEAAADLVARWRAGGRENRQDAKSAKVLQ